MESTVTTTANLFTGYTTNAKLREGYYNLAESMFLVYQNRDEWPGSEVQNFLATYEAQLEVFKQIQATTSWRKWLDPQVVPLAHRFSRETGQMLKSFMNSKHAALLGESRLQEIHMIYEALDEVAQGMENDNNLRTLQEFHSLLSGKELEEAQKSDVLAAVDRIRSHADIDAPDVEVTLSDTDIVKVLNTLPKDSLELDDMPV